MTKIRTETQGKLTFYFGVEQGTQEWLDLRSSYVTCSNALSLCCKGKNFAKEKNRQHADRSSPNASASTMRGHLLEDEVRGKLEELFNNEQHELITCSFITNSDFPGAGYSPDGIIRDRKTQEFIAPIEVKCFNDVLLDWNPQTRRMEKTYPYKHRECCKDVYNIPLENRLQFEMEMLITETTQLMVILYNPDADVEHGVPVFKMHIYEPEVRHKKDGTAYFAYQERIAEQILGKKFAV